MEQFLGTWLTFCWDMIARSALFLIIGFVLAGVIRAFVTQSVINKIFGEGWFSQIYKSSLVGVPLPLCSCSVLPVAAQLHQAGLSRAGTASFLISTPETGVDSIALSYRLLGPIFALARPLAALMTALVGGFAVRLMVPPIAGLKMAPVNPSGLSSDISLLGRVVEGLRYVQKNMFPELAYYLFWGYLLAGLAAALIPETSPAGNLPTGWQYLGVIIASLPVYVCATSSTPLAAVMLSLGVLPGAVLTFLLVGPATNLTSLVVQKKILGMRGTVVMTASIVITGVACGLLFDLLSDHLNLKNIGLDLGHPESIAWYDMTAGIILALLMVFYTARYYINKLKKQ